MKDEQNIIIKSRTSSEPIKLAHFLVLLVRKYMVKKYLISDRFDSLDRLFPKVF